MTPSLLLTVCYAQSARSFLLAPLLRTTQTTSRFWAPNRQAIMSTRQVVESELSRTASTCAKAFKVGYDRTDHLGRTIIPS